MSIGEKSSTGLDANLAAALSYLAFVVTGVVFFAMEKESRFVRFHAMQSIVFSLAALAFWVAYSIVTGIFMAIPVLGWILALLMVPLSLVLWLGMLVIWILLMVKAYNGERYKLPYLGEIAEKQLG